MEKMFHVLSQSFIYCFLFFSFLLFFDLMMRGSDSIFLGKKALKTRAISISFFLNILVNIGQITFYLLCVFPLKYILGIKVGGTENIQIKKPFMIIANHQSMYDSFLVLSAMGMRNFLASFPWRSPISRSFYDLPLYRIFSKCIGLYKIEPKGSLGESLVETLGYMKDNYSVFFFPEGQMVREGECVEPKKGIGYICFKKDVHILSVRIMYKGYKKNGLGKAHGSTIVFGKTIESADVRKRYSFECAHQELMKDIFLLKNMGDSEEISTVRHRGENKYFFNP